MELVEERLDEENENILSKLDNVIGLSNNKTVLRNIIRYAQVMRKNKCNVEFENYNIVIRNKSAYSRDEELISVIAELYYKNGIIQNPNYKYIESNNITEDKIDSKVEEGMIVIDLDYSTSKIRKIFENIIKDMPTKAVIIIENTYKEGEINACLNGYASWAIKIDEISKLEKEKHITKFMKTNKLTCNNKIVKELSAQPYWKIQNDLVNILVKCKIMNENDVSRILKKSNKEDEKEHIHHKKATKELEQLIGLEDVKEQIKKVVSYIKVSKDRKNMPMLHMCFNGNPGTGKTTVARLVGKIFEEEKILSEKSNFKEVQRADLIGEYVGQTAPKTQDIINSALGGVLFIDEAYSICSYIQDEAGRDYGSECIATLLKGMEDYRDNLCVILAGYTKEMEQMIKTNPGFESRIQFTIQFPDYSSEELYEIFKKMCRKEHYKLASSIKRELLKHFEIVRRQENFANARYVRSIFEKIKIEQASRVLLEKDNRDIIRKQDLNQVIAKQKYEKPIGKVIGFAS